jgi:hypothetical protein
MANNPIDINSFRHYLNFKSLGFTELYEITEPVGFDVANFVVKQDDQRFGRDVFYGNEQANEVFYNAWGFEKRDVMQVHNPQGNTSEYLDMGLSWILETWKRFGSEGEIERILTKDGITFTIGLLDMSNEPDTDGYSYFGCNLIQNNKISDYKKHLTSSIDLLGTKDINNLPITPAPTIKVLRHSVPIVKKSEWAKTGLNSLSNFSSGHFYTFNNNSITNGVSNTAISVAEVMRWSSAFPDGDGWRFYTQSQIEAGGYDFSVGSNGGAMKLINAVKKLTKTKVRVRFKGSLICRSHQSNLSFNYILMANNGDFLGNFQSGNYIKAFDVPVYYNVGSSPISVDIDVLVSLPFNIESSQTLYGCYTIINPAGLGGIANCSISIEQTKIEVIASETAVDTVVNMVRYIDVIKQCSKFINPTPIDAYEFDVNGQEYNNACWNRALLSMQTNNSLVLISPTNPLGENVGDVVNNSVDNGVMQLGLYFWNGTQWISLNGTINQVNLITPSTPVGVEGDIIFNTNTSVFPNGLCFWNGTSWQGLEYSRPFITNIEDAFGSSMTIETCSDYEIQEEKIYFGEFKDFYENIEIADFLTIPSKNFKERKNEKFKINNAKIAYDTYDTNRISESNNEDIHTSAEFDVPNKKSENKFERSIKYIRSGQTAQIMVDVETSKPATAYENDEKVFINSIVPLPSGSFNELENTLFVNIVDGLVSILNKKSDGSDDGVIINWISFGLSAGDSFEILSGGNVGNYTVFSVTNSEIKLTPIGFVPTNTGDLFIKIKYYYNNIFWQTETNERVNVISGLNNPDKYPNLYYTLKRTYLKWGSYFKTATPKVSGKILKKLKFWNNPTLKTQIGTNPIISELEDIIVDDLDGQVITDTIFDFEIHASFSEVLNLLNTIKNVRGFIRGLHIDGRIIKGYIQELDYTWKSGSLKLKLEEKYEPETIILNYSNGILSVNDAIYNLNGNVNWWKITGDYFECFDADNKPICNIRYYSDVSLNGVIYTNVDYLANALLSL